MPFDRKDDGSKPDFAISRRKFLSLGLVTAAAGIIPCSGLASSFPLTSSRSLSIHNLHTGETLDITYWEDGWYVHAALDKINHVFRDHYNDAIASIHTGLIDTLAALQRKIGTKEPLQLISGYRSPETNTNLRRKNRGVASNSLHMYGLAADINLPSLSLKKLREAAKSLKAGGVGYYPRSHFVHIDIGKVRYW